MRLVALLGAVAVVVGGCTSSRSAHPTGAASHPSQPSGQARGDGRSGIWHDALVVK